MSLYSHISEVYDKLFPINPATIDYIESIVPPSAERRLLDLGAATGGHVEAFARRGWDTLGIELDKSMAEAAALRAHVVHGSMLEADRFVVEDYGVRVYFGAVLCLGNTLPHIAPDALLPFFSMIRSLLHPGAPFIIQTINYANPEIQPGFVFPKIQNEDFSFERQYQEADDPGMIVFLTSFSRASSNYRDSTLLFRHLPGQIEAKLHEAGFRQIEKISDWGGKSFLAEVDRYLIAVGK